MDMFCTAVTWPSAGRSDAAAAAPANWPWVSWASRWRPNDRPARMAVPSTTSASAAWAGARPRFWPMSGSWRSARTDQGSTSSRPINQGTPRRPASGHQSSPISQTAHSAVPSSHSANSHSAMADRRATPRLTANSSTPATT